MTGQPGGDARRSYAGSVQLPSAASPPVPVPPRTREQRAEDDKRATEERKAAEKRILDRFNRWKGQLRDGFTEINSDIDFDLRRRMQNVRTAAENAVEATDPGPGWDAITEWLRTELVKEVHANHAFAVKSIRALSVSGAKYLGLDESQIIDPPPPVVPVDLSVSLKELPRPPHLAGLPSLIMNIVLRAYVGFVIFFVVTQAVHVQGNILFGIAPALLLGGVALQEERARRVTARRLTADQVLRNYITEFGMYATKNSRDLLRQQEQDIRDGYEALVDRRIDRLQRV